MHILKKNKNRSSLQTFFSSAAAAAFSSTSNNSLMYAKLCQHGQGSKFVFQNKSNKTYDVNYSTFWNDFSHYSVYGQCLGEKMKSPMDYSAVDSD